MPDATAEFFDAIGRRGHEPLLGSTSGTLRFDLAEGRRVEHWYVTIEKGDIAVSNKDADADAVVRLERSLFDSMATGKVNAMAAALRGVSGARGQPGARHLVPAALSRATEIPDPELGLEAQEERAMSTDLVQILDGNTFVVSDSRGDIEASLTDPRASSRSTRASCRRWVLTVNGQRLNALSTDDLQYFETRFFLVPGTGTVYVDAKLSVIRQRAVGDGFSEALTILNHDEKPVDAGGPDRGRQRLRRSVRGQGRARRRRARTTNRVERGRLVLGYRARHVRARDVDLGDRPGEDRREGSHLHRRRSQPHGQWTTDLDVVTAYARRGET